MWTLHQGDCLLILPTLPSDSIDSIVTDPPYGLEFMGEEWDAPWQVSSKSALFGKRDRELPGWGTTRNPTCRSCGGRLRGAKKCTCEIPDWDEAPEETRLRQMRGFQAWCESWAHELFRVLKPGGYLLAFGGTRTYHRLVCAIEDAGFEVRDQVDWVYGQGFPKSLDVSKAIDKMKGAERLEVGTKRAGIARGERTDYEVFHRSLPENEKWVSVTLPATPEAQRWDGWGTGLKPAHEPLCLARKPLEGTVAENVLKWGVGGLNIDGCRIEYRDDADKDAATPQGRCTAKSGALAGGMQNDGQRTEFERPPLRGRWPANVLFDEPAAEVLDQTTEHVKSTKPHPVHSNIEYGDGYGSIQQRNGQVVHYDEGNVTGASRFFYVAKASKSERWFYCLDCQGAFSPSEREEHWHGHVNQKGEKTWGHLESHPTQKPEGLMRYLVRLVTPLHGKVLDPFMGSGTTLVAAEAEGFDSTGIELDGHNCDIARQRLAR